MLGHASVVLLAHSARGFTHWWGANWFNLVQTLGILGGLLAGAAALRADLRARRAETLMAMTQYHREIWGRVFEDPSLDRVLDPSADIETQPVTNKERMLCRFLILHLFATFEARRAGLYRVTWREDRDLGELFNLPIPGAVWEELRRYQSGDFREFVERMRAEGKRFLAESGVGVQPGAPTPSGYE